MSVDSKEFGEWLQKGIENEWITNPFCNTHDVDPAMDEEEQKQWEEGFDPCQHVIRILV